MLLAKLDVGGVSLHIDPLAVEIVGPAMDAQSGAAVVGASLVTMRSGQSFAVRADPGELAEIISGLRHKATLAHSATLAGGLIRASNGIGEMPRNN